MEKIAYDFLARTEIPREILGEVVEYFAEDLTRESIVQIWKREEGYVIVYPKCAEASKARIQYSFPLDSEGVYVMTIHSHNTMPAFFSPIDDRDELSVPGLYGVIGEIEELEDEYTFSTIFRYTLGAGVEPIMVDEADIFC